MNCDVCPHGCSLGPGQVGRCRARGWRDGAALLRVPDGANNIYVLLDAGKDEKVRKVEFRDFEIFRIK